MSESYTRPTKLMVGIQPGPFAPYLIQYTSEMASFYQCSWIAAVIFQSEKISISDQKAINDLSHLVHQKNGTLIISHSKNVAETLLQTAHTQQITQLIIGRPKKQSLVKAFFFPSLVEKLLALAQNVDILAISTEERIPLNSVPKKMLPTKLNYFSILSSLIFTTVITIINLGLHQWLDYRSLGLVYLFGIYIGTLFWKNYSIVSGAILSALFWNLFFIPPRFTLHIEAPADWLMQIVFLVAGFTISKLLKELKQKENYLFKEVLQTQRQYNLIKMLASKDSAQRTLKSTIEFLKQEWNIDSWDLNTSEFNQLALDQQLSINDYKLEESNETQSFKIYDNKGQRLLAILKYQQNNDVRFFLIQVNYENEKTFEIHTYLETILSQLKSAFEKEHYNQVLTEKKVIDESEKIMKTILNSISHELRTPLSSIKGFASMLGSKQIHKSESFYQTASEEILISTERLDHVIQNLLDMGRLESEHLKLKEIHFDLIEAIEATVQKCHKNFTELSTTFEKNQEHIWFKGDIYLLQQTFENIIRNSYIYANRSPIKISAKKVTNSIIITFEDRGPGFQDTTQIFNKFYRESPQIPGGTGLGLSICKNIIELHQGHIEANNILPLGASIKITLPLDHSYESAL